MARTNQAARTYLKRMLLAMLSYLVLLFAVMLITNAYPDAWWRYVLLMVPIVPLVFVAWAVVRMMSDVDELQRRIQLEALAFAFGAGSLITFSYGMLQIAGLPEVSWLFVWPVYAACWVVGGLLAQRRYS